MPPAFLRRATAHDIPAMSRIRLSVRENALRDPARVTGQMYHDFLDQDGRGWIAQVDGETVAFCYANRNDGSIWALFVQPDHEGQGLAKRLLALATDWLFEIGYDEVGLSTGAGTRAELFYARQGWQRIAGDAPDAEFRLRRPPDNR